MRELEAKYNVVCLEVVVLWIKVGKVVHAVTLPCATGVKPFVTKEDNEKLVLVANILRTKLNGNVRIPKIPTCEYLHPNLHI